MVPEEIILIADERILAVPIRENGDPLLDLTQLDIAVDGRKKKDSNSYFLARKTVAEKVAETQRLLPSGITFLVIEAYRPLSLQQFYFDRYSEALRAMHGNWDKNKIYDEASKFVAPPAIIPPHSTGGAVDLTLVDLDGRELDMGTAVNADPEESENRCFTINPNVSGEAKKNRTILIDAMNKAGFVNYPTEWWHWSYGDRYWAYHSHANAALFGPAKEAGK